MDTSCPRPASGIKTLNVAGPRASNEPTIAEFVKKVLEDAFARIKP